MKKFKEFKGVLDGLRSSGSAPQKSETEIIETLRPENFYVCKTVRHGFPHKPTAMAYDPLQNLLAIGNKNGSLRIFGRPGVDRHIRHEGDVAIIQILFLINEGALVTVCSDDTLNLWNYRQKYPEIVNTLKFQRERLTFCHLPFQSKWLYVGTERGNVHVVNLESFTLSGYVINWNKAIELSRKTHPGPVVHLSDNPMDSTKLLIGFESGCVVLWDLKGKIAEHRFQCTEALKSASWHHEGKQFMCSHGDGSLTTWNYKQPGKPVAVNSPHAKADRDGKADPCKPIVKVEWKSVRNTEPFVIFSGGMPYDRSCRAPSITVVRGKSTTVLEMEHSIVDFVTLSHSPWQNDFHDPHAIVVLLQNDLVVVDLLTQGYPCFENPYPMDLHESPVTACTYYADPPGNLIPAFYSVGSKQTKQKKAGFSDKEWPIKGGEWGTSSCSYSEIILTGHADGSLRIWDASAVTLQVLYKVKTSKIFERHRKKDRENPELQDEDPFAIQNMFLDGESRMLTVAGATHVILFKFSKQDTQAEIPSLDISIVYENHEDMVDSPEFTYELTPPPSAKPHIGSQLSQGSMGSFSSNASDGTNKECATNVRVKSGSRKWNAGYQPDLVCMLTWNDGEPPGNITSISFNSTYGLLAFGNEHGLAIVDTVQKTCLLNMATPDLYGSLDPYQRLPRSPKSKKETNNTGQGNLTDDCKSPTVEQSKSAVRPTMSKYNRPKSMPLLAIHPPSLDVPDSCEDADDEDDGTMIEAAIEAYEQEVSSHSSSSSIRNENNGNVETTYSIHQKTTRVHHSVSRSKSAPLRENNASKVPVSGSNPNLNNSVEGVDNGNTPSSNQTSTKSTPKGSPRNSPMTSPSTPRSLKVTMQGGEIPSPLSSGSLIESPAESPKSPRREVCFDLQGATGCQEVFCEGDVAGDVQEPGSKQSQGVKRYMRKMSLKIKHRFTSIQRRHGYEKEDSVSPPIDRPCPPISRTQSSNLERIMAPAPSELTPPGRYKKKTGGKKEYLVDFLDLRSADERKPQWATCTVQQARNGNDKCDGTTFSRSRSSSMSSLENVGSEAVQCLMFADSYTRKTDSFTCPCLWVGTSLGSVLVIVLNMPPSNEQRMTQPVIVSPSGTIFRLKGSILDMSFLDCNGILIPTVADQWRDSNKEKDRSRTQSSSGGRPRISPTASTEMSDRQFAIICSEKQARVMSLPSQTCAYKVKLAESSFVTKAEVITFKDSVCLVCYIANGHIMAYSLPSLKPLLDVDFLPLTDLRIARTFSFGNAGNAMYFCSPSEVQKATISAEMSQQLGDMIGDLFLPCETPEAPKKGFFTSLFTGGSSILDREELFGEASGKASRGLARHIPGGMSQAQAAAGTLAGDLQETRRALSERGEKLGDLEERTAKMMAEAENFSSASHNLMNKYQNKKWYQF